MAKDARQLVTDITNQSRMQATLLDLPSSRSVRWTSHRKAAVVRSVHIGLLSFDEASERYALTREEFRTWEAEYDSLGRPGAATFQHAQHSKRKVSPRPH